MGFSRVMVFGAHNWAEEETAAAEMTEAFRATTPMPNLSSRYKQDLEAMIAPCFLRGDVLLAVQCTQCSALPAAERKACIAHVAKLLDCISNVWMQYDEMSEPELGAVVVVLEGFDEDTIVASWEPGDEMSYPVSTLDEQLSAFFK